MKRDETGITEVNSRDNSILKSILNDPDLISNMIKSITTAFLKSYDFSRNAVLRGLLESMRSESVKIQQEFLSNAAFVSEMAVRVAPYLQRLEFIASQDDPTGEKSLDAFTLWNSVDAASDNFADWLIDQIMTKAGLDKISKSVNYTFFDIYDLLAYKY